MYEKIVLQHNINNHKSTNQLKDILHTHITCNKNFRKLLQQSTVELIFWLPFKLFINFKFILRKCTIFKGPSQVYFR